MPVLGTPCGSDTQNVWVVQFGQWWRMTSLGGADLSTIVEERICIPLTGSIAELLYPYYCSLGFPTDGLAANRVRRAAHCEHARTAHPLGGSLSIATDDHTEHIASAPGDIELWSIVVLSRYRSLPFACRDLLAALAPRGLHLIVQLCPNLAHHSLLRPLFARLLHLHSKPFIQGV